MKKEQVKKGVSKKAIFFLMVFSILIGAVMVCTALYLLWPNFLYKQILFSLPNDPARTVVEQRTYVEESNTIQSIEKALPAVVAILPIDDLQRFKKSKIVTNENECKLLINSGFDCWYKGVNGVLLTGDGVGVTILSNLAENVEKSINNVPNSRENKFVALMNNHLEYDLEVIFRDEEYGLAFFQLIKKGEVGLPLEQRTKLFNLPTVEFGQIDNLKVGQKLNILSFNNVKDQVISKLVSITKLDLKNMDYWEIRDSDKSLLEIKLDQNFDSIFNGAPVLNLSGQLIGLNKLIMVDNIAFTKVVPIENISVSFLNSQKGILQNILGNKPNLGLKYLILDKYFAQKLGLSTEYGAYLIAGYSEDWQNLDLSSIRKDSNAQKLGLKPKDIILQVDGKQINAQNNLNDILLAKKLGDKIKLKVLRNEKELELEGVLE